MLKLYARAAAGAWCLLLAAAMSLADVGPAKAWIPSGSYRNSCGSIQVSNGTLTATCTAANGTTDPTSLQYGPCVGDIANFNGQLTCSNTALPGGSYTQSCRYINAWYNNHQIGTALFANCKTESGLWNSAYLGNVTQCTADGDIANLDGTLACMPGAHGYNPVGSYSDSCRNIWTFENTLNAECPTASGGGWVQALISTTTPCTAPIENYGGLLVCSTATPSGGSYTRSCTSVWALGNSNPPVLNAICTTAAGGSNITQLVGYNQCQGDIANFDGVLGCNMGGQPPAGSYSQSCRDIWLEYFTLNAECKNTSGAWVTTSLADVNDCDSNSITNYDGVLGCAGGTPNGGSFTQSCRNVWFLNGTTHAECKTRNGQWLSTSYGQSGFCPGGMSNNDGLLQCPGYSASAGNFPATYQVAGLQFRQQEQGLWCWAATGQIVTQYFGMAIRQCDEQTVEHGVSNCCGYPVFSMEFLTDQAMNCQGCNCGGGPPLQSYGLNFSNSGTPLSWTQLQTQFATQNEPITFAWNICGDIGHVLVAFGYTTAGGVNSVWIMDPDASEPYLDSYADWASNPNGVCTAGAAHAFTGNMYDIAL